MTLYDVLRVDTACSLDEMRAAYRQRARELHPDVNGAEDQAAGAMMAQLNDAWRVLSNPESRSAYDASIVVRRRAEHDVAARTVIPTPQPAPQATRSRRQAWVAGVQAQILRLSRLAGRSATQTLLVRSNRFPRPVYEEQVAIIVAELIKDTEARVRAARAAGAAPLDLGVGATLVGLRALAADLRRGASLGTNDELLIKADLVDRMWDVLAHELTKQLTVALGGNPRVGEQLRRS